MSCDRVVIIERLEIELDTKTAAKWFANLSDDDMADFLIRVAGEAQQRHREFRDRRNGRRRDQGAAEWDQIWTHGGNR